VNILENGIFPDCGKYCGVGLGNFDGLHRGHMALINTLVHKCRLNDLHSVVYTFKKHPENILRKKLFTPLIMTREQKTAILAKIDIDTLYFQEFDEEFSRMTADEFIKDILVEKLRSKLVVVGFDFRFGYMCRGDAEYLKKMGRKLGFAVIVIPPVKVGGEIVSSTLIRQYIAKGRMEKVFELLGRHFSISGKVVAGRREGRTMGFPTANILPEEYLIMPAPGVYVTRTLYQGQWYNSLTNVGICPTVKNDRTASVETHMIGFDQELYGKDIEVFFLKKLRSEKKFETHADLINQIKKDIEKARNEWY